MKRRTVALLVLISLFSGCAMIRGKVLISGPESGDSPLLYGSIRTDAIGGEVTALTIRAVEGRRSRVDLRRVDGLSVLGQSSDVFYREMVPAGVYHVERVSFGYRGTTHYEDVEPGELVIEVQPTGVQFFGEILITQPGMSFRFSWSPGALDRNDIVSRVQNHLRYSDWDEVIERYRQSL